MTIEERVRAEHPFFRMHEGAKTWIVSPEEFPVWYEDLIAERVAWATEAEAQRVAEAAEETRRTQVKALYDALKAGTATSAQTQKVLAFLLRERFRELAP
jgi:non-homologous end joining protein Ku